MRHVQLTMQAATVDAAEAFRQIADFTRYPELVNVVRAVTVHPAKPGEPVASDWEVLFRNGILRWSEVDQIDAASRRIDFEQTTGDFQEFGGVWLVEPADGGCLIHFRAEFDFGIPSLAGILDPIAARVIKETIATVIAGLLGAVHEVDHDIPATVHRTTPAADGRRAA